MSKKNSKTPPAKSSPLMIFMKLTALLLSLYFSGAMPILSGAGLVYNRESYGTELEKTGLFLIISAVLMLFGAFLCLFRKNLTNMLSIPLSIAGLILCLVMLNSLTSHADASGWTDKYTLLPVSDMYSRRILPCIAPVVLTVTIAAIQLCSHDLCAQRRVRRDG